KKTRNNLYQQMTDAAFGQEDWVVSGRVNEVKASIKTENDLLMKKETSVHRWHHMRDLSMRFVVGHVIIIIMYWKNNQVGNEMIASMIIAVYELMMVSVTHVLLQIGYAVEEKPK